MTRCYFAHGGNELVVGGKLTVLPEATVNDPGHVLPSGGFTPAACLASSEASTLKALVADFNELLAALKDAGLMAGGPVPEEETADDPDS